MAIPRGRRALRTQGAPWRQKRGLSCRSGKVRWAAGIQGPEWKVYSRAIDTLRKAGIRFMLGGGFAYATFTGRWRDTKDIDFYIEPKDRDRAVAALTRAGFADFYRKLPYDRKWIYRSTRAQVIVDIIWAMANQRAQVDSTWFERSHRFAIRGQELAVLPLEELIWCKLYIVQRDRCDWTDVFNLVYAAGHQIDWKHLLQRLNGDSALLSALLTVYGWLCPNCGVKPPALAWSALKLRKPARGTLPSTRCRARLLDSRGWFAALQPAHRKLEI